MTHQAPNVQMIDDVAGSLGCRLIELPSPLDQERGSLAVAQAFDDVPFAIQRVFLLHDLPHGIVRGGHAHRETEQLMIAAAGSFDIVLDNGVLQATVRLDRANLGLYVPPMIWREMTNFSHDAVMLVLASTRFEEADYIRDRQAFLALR